MNLYFNRKDEQYTSYNKGVGYPFLDGFNPIVAENYKNILESSELSGSW
jgi:hypothetical protein